MRVRELAWGLPVWPVAPVVVSLVSVEDWDMAPDSVIGLLFGMALAYGIAGLLVWLPTGVWLSRRAWRAGITTGIAFAALGFVLGAAMATLLVFAVGHPTWPFSLGTVLQVAAIAAGASLLGWLLAAAIRANAVRRAPTAVPL